MFDSSCSSLVVTCSGTQHKSSSNRVSVCWFSLVRPEPPAPLAIASSLHYCARFASAASLSTCLMGFIQGHRRCCLTVAIVLYSSSTSTHSGAVWWLAVPASVLAMPAIVTCHYLPEEFVKIKGSEHKVRIDSGNSSDFLSKIYTTVENTGRNQSKFNRSVS
ncbi:hypothetical protein PoB_005541300 [Plakobranchus ocellatus]|uniref:Uncharacterized protein n=1 Tax=Plakobranchus ocellatus TaxID=259542 RepID=A0AAV4CBP7_9GAST|nr:hypothetical protein PoB_005541300 [Plakobranchus ocellatus]